MSKLTGTVLLAVLAVVLLAAGCGPTPTPTPPGESLEWEKIADDWGAGGSYRYRESKPKIVITADLAETSVLSGQLRLNHLDIMQNTDFADYLVVTIYQGEKGTTGYSVEVVDVRLESNVITIYARFLTPPTPAPGQIVGVGPAVTSPYCVLRVKKTPELKGDFTFVLIANGKKIMRQQHSIP